VGEVISRTWRTASKMKEFRGPLAELGDKGGWIAHRGSGHHAWDKPSGQIGRSGNASGSGTLGLVLESGAIVWGQMGNTNGSIPAVQPFYSRPM